MSVYGLISVRGRNWAPTYFARIVPRFFSYNMKELSIFVDECGNFGSYDFNSPMYIFSLVCHDQSNDISDSVFSLKQELKYIDYGTTYFHAGPIIRKENEYKNLDIQTRRRIFNKMSFFVNHLDFKYASVMVDKKHINNESNLIVELSKQLGTIIKNNYSFFQSFNKVKVYYDNGQKQLSKLLMIALTTLLDKPEFRKVKPQDYNLFQVADFVSTLEFLHYKFKCKSVTKNEKYFFGENRDFYRNYYRQLAKKKIV